MGTVFADQPFFTHEEFTLVDCCLAPILWRLDLLGIKLPTSKQAKPLIDYMQRIFERPAFALSLSAAERDMNG